jgi:hypothetical protein
MGRASSSKKVARAASTGGGRTARGARPLGWYAAITLVVVLGVAGIVFSRQERRTELASGGSVAPVANVDHWHAAYGVYLCDSFAPSLTDETDPKGIHSHGDGIIHIHPFVRSSAGKNAVLGVFADATGLKITDKELQVPGGKKYTANDTKCGDKVGIVQVKVNDKVVTNDVRNIRLHDQDLITIAFAPEDAELPKPPTADDLARLNPETEQVTPATETTEQTGTTVAGADGATTTTAAGAAGDTSGSTSTTAAP